MDADIEQLQQKQRDALAEYQRAFADFSDDDAARKRRVAAQDTLKKLAQDELAILARLERIEALEKALAQLKGAQVVVSQLNWSTGFALDAASAISRFLDDWLVRSKGHVVTRNLTQPNVRRRRFQPAGDTQDKLTASSRCRQNSLDLLRPRRTASGPLVARLNFSFASDSRRRRPASGAGASACNASRTIFIGRRLSRRRRAVAIAVGQAARSIRREVRIR
jgi:hypothetical protein